MKKLVGSVLALFASIAFGATTVPVQLLNPAGSSSGQTIVSTGSSSSPGWATVSLSGLSSIAANTVVANFTGSSAAPVAFAMPSCSTSSSALNYTSGTGIGCNTSINAATLGGNSIGTSGTAVPLLSGANTWGGAQTFSALIAPSSTIGIKGTTANDNAQAGSWGEFPTPTNQSGISITSGTPLNVSQATSLAAGDYEITASACFTGASTTVGTYFEVGVSTTSATFGPFPQNTTILGVSVTGANGVLCISSPPVRQTFASATTVYAVAESFFSTSTMTVSGNLHIRRAR